MLHSITILYTHRLIADALKCLIECQGEFKVNEMHELSSSVAFLNVQKPSVVIIEISCPKTLLIDTIKIIKELGLKVVIVGLLATNGLMEEMIEANVDAYVLKSCRKLNLLTSIDQVLNNKKFFCYSITENLNKRLQNQDDTQLTIREKDVLKGVVNFQSTKQIASALNITTATVRTHRKNIMSKLGAKNYIGLLRRACSEGLLSDENDKFCEGCVKNKCRSPLFG